MPRTRGSGSIYKQKNSAVFWVKYYRNGQAYRESTRTTNKQEAKDFLKQRLGEIATGTFYGPLAERVTIAELAGDFLRDYRINDRKSIDDVEARWTLHLEPFFGHMKACEVSSDLVARYVDRRREEKASNATINREMAALKRMFRLGLQCTPPKVNRVPKIPRLAENNIRTGFLEDGQFEKIVSHCPELWFRAIVEVGRTYGWRVGELRQLRVRQVDLLGKVIRLDPGTTKNRDGREVSMTQNVYALLLVCVSGKAARGLCVHSSRWKARPGFQGDLAQCVCCCWSAEASVSRPPQNSSPKPSQGRSRRRRDYEDRRLEDSECFRAVRNRVTD